jgi:transcriptional regulator GlxA family with amidase domain
MTTTGILMFEDMEELDFVGPWEVLTMGKLLRPDDRVIAIGLDAAEIRCSKGMHMRPDVGLSEAPKLDVLLVPGGDGTRALMKDERLIGWVQARAKETQWTSSVCSGSLVLAQAGLLDGRKATTHWSVLDELRRFQSVEVLERVRFVRDGQLVTSAGVSAGIDMALWLFGQIASPEAARRVQRLMQYDPAPPYQAVA